MPRRRRRSRTVLGFGLMARRPDCSIGRAGGDGLAAMGLGLRRAPESDRFDRRDARPSCGCQRRSHRFRAAAARSRSWRTNTTSSSSAPAPAATWRPSAPRSSASRWPSSRSRRRSAAPASSGAAFPTKALLEHAHALKVAQAREGVGPDHRRQPPSRLDMTQVQARKDKIVTALTKGVEFLFKKNKIDWIKGTARLAGNGNVEVTGEQAQTLARDEGDHRRHRLAAAQRARHRDRPQADHHERRGDRPAGGAEVDRHPGQRRRRRRVRVDLPALRQRGHDHRAAAAARAGRGRGGVGRAGEVVQEAGHHGAHRHEGDERAGVGATAWTSRRSWPTARPRSCTADYLLVATGRGPVTDGPRRGGGRPRDGARLHRRGRALPHQRAGHFGDRRRHHARRAGRTRSSRTCRRPKASPLAERIAGQPPRSINYDHVPGCTYCDPEIGSVGLTEQKAQGARLRRARRHVPVRRSAARRSPARPTGS